MLLKASINHIDNNNTEYHLNFTGSSINPFESKIKVIPNHYYSFVIDSNKKNFNIFSPKESDANDIYELKAKLKEIMPSNLLLTV